MKGDDIIKKYHMILVVLTLVIIITASIYYSYLSNQKIERFVSKHVNLLKLMKEIDFDKSENNWYDSKGNKRSEKDLTEQLNLHEQWLEKIEIKAKEKVEEEYVTLDEVNKDHRIEDNFNNILKLIIENTFVRDDDYLKAKSNTKKDIQLLVNDKRRLNLSGANFEKYFFIGNDFRGSILRGTKFNKSIHIFNDFSYADLKGAEFSQTYQLSNNYQQANVDYAKFNESIMFLPIFNKLIMNKAYYDYSIIIGGNFKNTKIHYSSMKNANLYFPDFENTEIISTSLKNLFYISCQFAKKHPEFEETFAIDRNDKFQICSGDNSVEITRAYDLKTVLAPREDLLNLKNENIGKGFLSSEKELNTAIKRTININKNKLISVIEWILFDLTCEYGANSFRPLIVIGILWIYFSLYYYGYLFSEKTNGIVLTTYGKYKIQGRRERQFKLHSKKYYSKNGKINYKHLIPNNFRDIKISLLFSLFGALRIGYSEYKINYIIKVLMPYEYDLIGNGNTKIISGIQSIVSAYLLFLAIISYFGTPFNVN